MGLVPPGVRNPFAPVDQKTVYGAFKASGSFDPDALYAQKESMLGPYRNLKRLAGLGIIAGLLVISFGMATIGVPIVASAWLLWRYQTRQSRTIEAGYAQYVGADMG